MKLGAIDRPLLITAAGLITYGIIVLYSAGQTDVPTQATGVWWHQFIWAGMGIVVAAVAYRVSPRILEWAAPALYGFGVLLLVATLVVGTGAGTAASSKSWLAIGGLRIGQPAEFAKLATVLMLARYLSSLKEPPRSFGDLIKPGILVGIPFLLIMKQPDLGSAIVFIGFTFAMLFWSGVRPRLLFLLASPALSLLLAFSNLSWALWIVAFFLVLLWWRPYIVDAGIALFGNVVTGLIALPLWKHLAPYQQDRLITFLNPEADPRGSGYHALQSKVAIGSGGWFGTGYTQGPQKRLAFLPEQHTDFVFSVVGEELGFIGVMLALGLFLALFLILVRIARRATDPFSSLVISGIVGLWFTHVWENVGMVVNIMPITGIPLPFFSYGGSFFLICCLCLGIALRVSADARQGGYVDA